MSHLVLRRFALSVAMLGGCWLSLTQASAQGGASSSACWKSGYQMGQLWAGIGSADGFRITFGCVASSGHPAMIPGPYAELSVPKISTTSSPRDGMTTVEFVIDGQVMPMQLEAKTGEDQIELFSPADKASQQSVLRIVNALGTAKALEVRTAFFKQGVSLNGAGPALADIAACVKETSR